MLTSFVGTEWKDWSRNSDQKRSFRSKANEPKDLVWVCLTGDGFERPSDIAVANGKSRSYKKGDSHHGNSWTQVDGAEFTSGWYLGHATGIKEALSIVKDGGANASFRPKCDCPAGENGVYCFPLKTLDEEDIARYVKNHSGNTYDRGAIVIMKFTGAILKGNGSLKLDDGQVAYYKQNTNGFLQVAAHPSCLQHP